MKRIRRFSFQIGCPTFLDYEEKIKKLSQSINSHKIISNKIDKAQELLDIVNVLSTCPKFDEEKDCCQRCRFILHLRQESAKMIIDVNGIAS